MTDKQPNTDRPKLVLPQGHQRLLLHSCCAPCSGDMIETLIDSGIELTLFFYNPNIHPQEEYLRRKQESILFAKKVGIIFIDADYDPKSWFAQTKGMEHEPERGIRCTRCFDIRLSRTAQYAHEHDFSVFTTSLGISRWKNMQQVHACGHQAASVYPELIFWDHNWRKGGGSARMLEVSKREHFYQQNYCGCAYSLRDSQNRKTSIATD